MDVRPMASSSQVASAAAAIGARDTLAVSFGLGAGGALAYCLFRLVNSGCLSGYGALGILGIGWG